MLQKKRSRRYRIAPPEPQRLKRSPELRAKVSECYRDLPPVYVRVRKKTVQGSAALGGFLFCNVGLRQLGNPRSLDRRQLSKQLASRISLGCLMHANALDSDNCNHIASLCSGCGHSSDKASFFHPTEAPCQNFCARHDLGAERLEVSSFRLTPD